MIEALIALRIEPSGLFAWLLRQDGEAAWHTMLDLAQGKHVRSYYVLDDSADEAAYAEAVAALDRRAKDSLAAHLSNEVLTEKWIGCAETHPALADQISAAEYPIQMWLFRYEAGQRERDEALIRRIVSRRSA
ncbi:hypothetical protein JJJ17_10960 [Paracoccus caeni]|uniref:Uncharacterized protein n=1 Tax=Paracoccus caeni TaxID=657651 RepID=A0A934SG84_9RHOB|nr:hypothetical protein [Paracoccus caeni]MBK4216446.1 hypothetical protein [Paracoccus caeni]